MWSLTIDNTTRVPAFRHVIAIATYVTLQVARYIIRYYLTSSIFIYIFIFILEANYMYIFS